MHPNSIPKRGSGICSSDGNSRISAVGISHTWLMSFDGQKNVCDIDRPCCNSVSLIQVVLFRQGSNELDSSCSRERSSPVMLSAAKHLAADRDRPFAALRVTGCDESTCQGLCFTIEPCLSEESRLQGPSYQRKA